MLQIEILRNDTIFSTEYTVTYINNFLPRDKRRGFFVAHSIDAALQQLRKIAKDQTATLLESIVKERRFVYTQFWHPKTADDMAIQKRYIEALNKINRVYESLYQKQYKDAIGIILSLCNGELKMIIPREGKTKHEDIKNKVNAIKEFWATKAQKLVETSDEQVRIVI